MRLLLGDIYQWLAVHTGEVLMVLFVLLAAWVAGLFR